MPVVSRRNVHGATSLDGLCVANGNWLLYSIHAEVRAKELPNPCLLLGLHLS